MRGTGTQTDPYLIETWDDFFDMTDDSLSTYYMLANDLDGNDYNGGVFGYNNIVHTNLDGNGHSIRNLYYMAASSNYSRYMMRPKSASGVWRNLTLENIQTNCSVFGYQFIQYHMTMQNCRISAECYAFADTLIIHLTECTLSLKAVAAYQNSVYNDSYAPIFSRCSANIRLHAPIMHCFMIGLHSTRLEMQLDQHATNINSNPPVVSNSVLAISMPAEATDLAYVIRGDSASPSVLDSTLWNGAPTSGITNVILLPTEDMKNADALNAAGFSVVRVS